MAAEFGIVASALSVAALFNNCVTCFEYVQLGRHFAEDYEHHQLKLVVAQLRLSRWGKAVHISEDPRFAEMTPSSSTVQETRDVLENIDRLFHTVQTASKRYEESVQSGNLEVCNLSDLPPAAERVRSRLVDVIRKRQSSTSLMKKARWALYDNKNFEKLVTRITGFVEDLEDLWPVDKAVTTRLVEIEIEEVDSEPDLALLKTASEGVDLAVSEASAAKAQLLVGSQNKVGKVAVNGESRFHAGMYVASGFGGKHYVEDKSINTVDSVDGKGKARIQIGTSYGGKSIFED